MGKGNIWVLRDETTSGLLEQAIQNGEYEIQSFKSLSDLSRAYADGSTSRVLVLSDSTQTHSDLLSFLEKRSAQTRDLGVIVISSQPTRDSVRQVLAAGASDIYAAPALESALLGKIDHLLSRASGLDGGIEFDPLHATLVTQGKRSHPLTLKEYQILYFLNSSPQKMASRKALLESLWSGSRVERKTVDMHVSNLRKKVANVGLQITYQAPDSFQLRFSIESDSNGQA